MPRRNAYKWMRNTLMLVAAAVVVYQVAVYAVAHSRQVSQQQVCAQNLKTMGEACKMYQDNWHDVLVPYGAPFAWAGAGGAIWPQLLDPYLKQLVPAEPGKMGKVFKCPRRVEEETHWCYERSYGINDRCGGWRPDKKPVVVPLRSIKYPGSTIRITEMRWEAQGGSYFAAKPSEFRPGDPTCHLFPEWHMGTGNVLWIDGHVSSMTQKQYNMRDKGPYDGNIWLRLEGPKPPVPGRRM